MPSGAFPVCRGPGTMPVLLSAVAPAEPWVELNFLLIVIALVLLNLLLRNE